MPHGPGVCVGSWGRAEASLVTVEVCTVMASCIRNSVTLLRDVEGGVSATEERLGVYNELHTSNVSFFFPESSLILKQRMGSR